MAVQTTNVSGLAAIRIILSQATTQLFLTGAADLQVLTLCLQQDSTGGRLVTSGNIPGIADLDLTAGADTVYTLVYDAAFNEWTIQAVSNSGDAISSPEIVGLVNSNAVGFANYTTAGVPSTLLAAGAPAGTYRLSLYGVVTTALTGNSVSAAGFTLGYTDDDEAQTKAAAYSAITAGGVVELVYTFRSTGAAAITITGTATTGNPTAGVTAVSAVLERIA
jgi:hypothetical protein